MPDWLAKNRDSFAILWVFKALQAGKFRCPSQRRSPDLRDWRLTIGPNDDFAHRLAPDASVAACGRPRRRAAAICSLSSLAMHRLRDPRSEIRVNLETLAVILFFRKNNRQFFPRLERSVQMASAAAGVDQVLRQRALLLSPRP
jgi:hypothetical protein